MVRMVRMASVAVAAVVAIALAGCRGGSVAESEATAKETAMTTGESEPRAARGSEPAVGEAERAVAETERAVAAAERAVAGAEPAVAEAASAAVGGRDGAAERAAGDEREGVYRFSAASIDGREVALSGYAGKVLLIVNVASRCGNTPQYKGLQALYESKGDAGLVVLGFPANDFGNQEPGGNAEIQAFCEERFGVTFPLFAKIAVKGPDIHPLYAWLTDPQAHPDHGGEIEWNFAKFLVGRDGRVAARFTPRTQPDSPALVEAVEAALATAR